MMENRRRTDRRALLHKNPVIGTLKGYDQLQNLVLDDVREEFSGTLGNSLRTHVSERSLTSSRSLSVKDRPSRQLGLVVVRGPTLVLITPTDGYEGEITKRDL
jgi:U6 snRNA-associated Sm-like protein LSm7